MRNLVLLSIFATVIICLFFAHDAIAATTITARPFNDLSEDKLLEQSEPFISGWTITLNGTLTNGTVIKPISLVSNPTAVFTNVQPGRYTLTSTVLPGYVPDTPTQINGITVSATSLTFDFGNNQPRMIIARPFADTNGNGMLNSGEPQLNGWTVSMTGKLNNGTVIIPIVGTSAKLAGVSFANVYPGTYSLIETNQLGFTQSTKNPTSFILATINPQVLFGNTLSGTITAIPFNDTNKNGIQDSSESQLSGWTFTLSGKLTNGTIPAPKVIVSSPSAIFSNLPPGNYTLTETNQTGYTNSIANSIRNISVAGNTQTFYFGSYQIPTQSCNVQISALSLYNVGQNVRINSTVTGVLSPTYQWNVTGNIIKDYQELTSAPFSTTTMSPNDFKNPYLSFYWLPDPSQVYPNNATVTHSVSVSINGGLCTSTTNINVERNTSNSSRNSNYWYVIANHPMGNTSAVLNEHMIWHLGNVINRANYSGSVFFNFHHQYIANHNSWLALMGYQSPVLAWNPASRYPIGHEFDFPRNPWSSRPIPSWFTIAGGTSMRPTATVNGHAEPCDTQSGQQKLADFPADLNLLGCAFTAPYHNTVHWEVGGLLGPVGKSPMDPLFWPWHTFVDEVKQNRTNLVTTTSGLLIAQSDSAKLSLVSSGGIASPPQVAWQYPYLISPYLVKFPNSITVIFGEQVKGVQAGDLSVDASPATLVTVTGNESYVFSGFHTPLIGTVQVNLVAGHITGAYSNPFAGTSWSYKLLDPNADDDNDGLSNYQEVMTYHTNPEVADTMMDGISDGYKVAHSCLDPLISYAAPEDFSGNPIPGTAPVRSHHVGLSVIDAYQQGINPCRA